MNLKIIEKAHVFSTWVRKTTHGPWAIFEIKFRKKTNICSQK
jgi:hypothetical protein